MAHRNLIGGTVYEAKGGRCRVGGTGYAIQKGRTLIGGTGYDVSFVTSPLVNITGSGVQKSAVYASAAINGTTYTSAASDIVVAPGDVIAFYINALRSGTASVSVNGDTVATIANGNKTYSWTVPQNVAQITVNLAVGGGTVLNYAGQITVTY